MDEIIQVPALQRNQLHCGVQDWWGCAGAEKSLHASTPDPLSEGLMVAWVGYTTIYFSLDCKHVKRIKLYCPSLATDFIVIVQVNMSLRKQVGELEVAATCIKLRIII